MICMVLHDLRRCMPVQPEFWVEGDAVQKGKLRFRHEGETILPGCCTRSALVSIRSPTVLASQQHWHELAAAGKGT